MDHPCFWWKILQGVSRFDNYKGGSNYKTREIVSMNESSGSIGTN